MKWTKDKPAKQGWYWESDKFGNIIISYFDSFRILRLLESYDDGRKFAGPLEKPKD